MKIGIQNISLDVQSNQVIARLCDGEQTEAIRRDTRLRRGNLGRGQLYVVSEEYLKTLHRSVENHGITLGIDTARVRFKDAMKKLVDQALDQE